MNKYTLTFLIVVMILQTLSAQPPKYYEKEYHWDVTDYSIDVIQVSDTFILQSYRKNPLITWSSNLIKMNKYGEILTIVCYIDDNYDTSFRKIIPYSKGYFLAGWKKHKSDGEAHAYYALTDKQGQILNASYVEDTTFRSAFFTGVATQDGGFLLGGRIASNLPPTPNYLESYLVKIDSTGKQVYQRIFDDFLGNNWIRDIKAAPDGSGYYLYGTTSFVSGYSDVYLMKVNEEGTILWKKTYDYLQEEAATGLELTSDNGFIFTLTINDSHAYTQIHKINENRTLEWRQQGTLFRGIGAIAPIQLSDGSYIVVGASEWEFPNSVDLNMQLAKLDSSGNILWQRLYGGEWDDYGYDMMVMNQRMDGKDGFVVVGRTETANDANVYLIKTNCMGLLTEPQTSFSTEQDPENNLTYHFTNHSQYVYPDSIDGGHFLWDFGDGATSTDLHPIHSYANKGESRIVTLTAIVCSDTSRFDIKVITGEEIVGIEDLEDSLPAFSFKLYPNPVSNGQVRVDYDLPKEGLLQLYDLQGRLMDNWKLRVDNEILDLGLGGFAEGMYLYRLVSEGRTLKSGKLVVE